MTLNKKAAQTINPTLLMIFGVTLMAVLGVSSITPAFPKIIAQFDLTDGQVGLLITFFTAPAVILTPVLGIAADRLGRKRILVSSLLLFGLAGSLCGFATSFNMLLILRAIQGAGAASLGALNTTVIGDLYHGHQRTRIMGLNASVLSIGTASYPLVGGMLATFAWNYPFFLPLLAVPLGIAVAFFLKNPEPDATMNLKAYFTGAWNGIRNKRVLAIFLIGILTFIILFGCLSTAFTVMLGQTFGASSLQIGIIMFIMSITTAITSSQLGRLSGRFKREIMLAFGFICYMAALLLIAFIDTLWLFIVPMLIFGIGHGMIIPVSQTLLADEAILEYRAAFMSLNGAMLRIGQSLGPPLITLAYTANTKWAFFLGILLSIMSFLVVTFGLLKKTDKPV